MTRLTNDLREQIIDRAMDATYLEKIKEFEAEENKVGLILYKSSFPKSVLDNVKKLPQEWTRKDSCLRFNCGGYDIRLSVPEPVPVPFSRDCSRIGDFSADSIEANLGKDFVSRKVTFDEEMRMTRRQLKTVIYNCSTIKQLKTNWPQGEKFYKIFETSPDIKTGLPAIQITELNKMLGLDQ